MAEGLKTRASVSGSNAGFRCEIPFRVSSSRAAFWTRSIGTGAEVPGRWSGRVSGWESARNAPAGRVRRSESAKPVNAQSWATQVGTARPSTPLADGKHPAWSPLDRHHACPRLIATSAARFPRISGACLETNCSDACVPESDPVVLADSYCSRSPFEKRYSLVAAWCAQNGSLFVPSDQPSSAPGICSALPP